MSYHQNAEPARVDTRLLSLLVPATTVDPIDAEFGVTRSASAEVSEQLTKVREERALAAARDTAIQLEAEISKLNDLSNALANQEVNKIRAARGIERDAKSVLEALGETRKIAQESNNWLPLANFVNNHEFKDGEEVWASKFVQVRNPGGAKNAPAMVKRVRKL